MDKQRILVVDDEEDLREILKFNLESEGYLVDTAPSAEEALKMLAEEYNLIITRDTAFPCNLWIYCHMPDSAL